MLYQTQQQQQSAYTSSSQSQFLTATQRKCPFKKSKPDNSLSRSQSMVMQQQPAPSQSQANLRRLPTSSSMRRVKSDNLSADYTTLAPQMGDYLAGADVSNITYDLDQVGQQNLNVPDLGELPLEYLQRRSMAQELPFLCSSSNDWFSTQTPGDSGSGSPFTPSPPSLFSGLTTADGALPLSREASAHSPVVADSNPTAMVRLPSYQTSFSGQGYHHSPDMDCIGMSWDSLLPPSLDKSNAAHQNLLGVGGMNPLPTYPGLDIAHDIGAVSCPSAVQSETLSRSDSSSSENSGKGSASKTSMRSREALKRVNKSSTKLIVAKPLDASSTHLARLTKHAQAKPSLRRRKDKVYCDECPEGSQQSFRGEHEVRRHKKIKHREWAEKWMILDATIAGRQPTVAMPKRLEDCKHCQKNKLYKQLHNATAHIRRCHFNPRDKAPNKEDGPREKRGGKGGGKWPVMEEVKLWVRKVWVPAAMEELPAHITLNDVLTLNEPQLKSKLVDGSEGQPPVNVLLYAEDVQTDDALAYFGQPPYEANPAAQLMGSVMLDTSNSFGFATEQDMQAPRFFDDVPINNVQQPQAGFPDLEPALALLGPTMLGAQDLWSANLGHSSS
jgi:hypothetical protein